MSKTAIHAKISPLLRPDISRTAGNIALIRALEFLKSSEKKLFSDPYARQFVTASQRALLGLAHLPAVRGLLEDYFDWRAPGARSSGAARTRLIDDWVREALAAGVRQVVILGAGFDCRALRMGELTTIPVFEVDRAAMIARKERVLEGIQTPRNVRRLGVDFRKDNLGNRLLDAGCSAQLRTLYIWEGVTNYLDSHFVDAVFDSFAQGTSLGSRIIFTYVHADLLEGRFATPGVERLTAVLLSYGEPWTFGFRPEEVPVYLVKKGLQMMIDLGAGDYRRKYTSLGHKLIGYEFYRAALAEKVVDATH
jgi:methyltransferase (TIGR00027 family)